MSGILDRGLQYWLHNQPRVTWVSALWPVESRVRVVLLIECIAINCSQDKASRSEFHSETEMAQD